MPSKIYQTSRSNVFIHFNSAKSRKKMPSKGYSLHVGIPLFSAPLMREFNIFFLITLGSRLGEQNTHSQVNPQESEA